MAKLKEEVSFYVKNTSNCDGLSLMTIGRLGREWIGSEIVLPFGPEGEEHVVVGWTDLFGGSPCTVRVFKAVGPNGEEGYAVLGGNSGVRILDDDVEPIAGVDEHLPRGWGQPFIWVEDAHDLPDSVLAVVEVEEAQKVRLEKTRDGKSAMWETGGSSTNSGDATIIAGPRGEKLTPIYVPRDGYMTGRHALFIVEPGCHVIEAFYEHPELETYVYRIDTIDKDDKGDYIATVSQLYYFKNGEWDHDAPEYLAEAIVAAEEKSMCFHCREAHYAR